MKLMNYWKKTAAVSILLMCLSIFSAAVKQNDKLPPHHRTWLEEEVVYIITPVEREVFLSLRTDREREMFIEAFWKQRDPTPGSPENEFRTEHYRRLAHANRFLGRETPRPGWRTDRGRIYIILGEPNDIQRFDGRSGIYASEIWFYQGLDAPGLPAGFYVVFFQESGHGEYRLYSPARDGPQALLAGYMGSPTDYEQAYQRLREIEPTLAEVSLSLIPGETTSTFGQPSLSSDMFLQRVEALPKTRVSETYARKFLEYKDVIEVEYTANYLDSDALVRVFRDAATGTSFVHFSVEPQRLSVNQYDRRFYTTLILNGSLSTPDGRRVYQFDRTYHINLTEEQIRSADRQPFNLLDVFPIVPGEYRLSLLLKNEASKEFSSLERTLHVPESGKGILLMSPVLAYRTARSDASPGALRAFQLGRTRLFVQPGRVFLPSENLAVAFQVLGLEGEMLRTSEIRISFMRDGRIFREETRKASDIPGLPDVILEFPLTDFPPAHYSVRVGIIADGKDIVSAEEAFGVTFAAFMPRPWVFSRLYPPAGAAAHELELGMQLLNLGRITEARALLERAASDMPDSVEAALALAHLLLSEKEPAAAAEALAPFLLDEAADYEVFFIAGTALRESGDPGRALEVFDKAVGRFGVNASLLNAIGDCHAALGNAGDALAAWERSLELSPDQPEIRTKAEKLRKK